MWTERTKNESTEFGHTDALLEVRNLSASLKEHPHLPSVLNQISFRLNAGEVLGVLGESGAGKTTLGMAIVGLLPRSKWQISGEVLLNGKSWESGRNDQGTKPRLAIIHQDSGVLNPVLRVGAQIAEVFYSRGVRNWSVCRKFAQALLADVGFPDPEAIYLRYPHQLSGGERQRIVIAQVLAYEPSVLVADEPTASLDEKTGDEITNILKRLVAGKGIALVVISHDSKLLAKVADRILVLYAGEVIEVGVTADILSAPRHPYTQALLRCFFLPEFVASSGWKPPLPFIPGRVDTSSDRTQHCVYENRCDERMHVCKHSHPLQADVTVLHQVSCFKFERIDV